MHRFESPVFLILTYELERSFIKRVNRRYSVEYMPVTFVTVDHSVSSVPPVSET
jgi:hypothetical protein